MVVGDASLGSRASFYDRGRAEQPHLAPRMVDREVVEEVVVGVTEA